MNEAYSDLKVHMNEAFNNRPFCFASLWENVSTSKSLRIFVYKSGIITPYLKGQI
jgi:hypothetical protein